MGRGSLPLRAHLLRLRHSAFGDIDADDLAQETYRRAVASLHRYRADGPAKHWLLTIARNLCRDAWKQQRRRRELLAQQAGLAAVGEAVMGRQIGRKALLWGGIAGTIPDLDVFVPLGNAVMDFTYHRAASHSLFVLALLTPLLVWLVNRIHPQHRDLTKRWAFMLYAVFITHVLLDSFTTYGTQIFWPIDNTPVALSTIFIIDPLYTLPLLLGLAGDLAACELSEVSLIASDLVRFLPAAVKTVYGDTG